MTLKLILQLSDTMRAYLVEMRALANDRYGREVLIGLTPEESLFYLAYGEDRIKGIYRNSDDSDRYLRLHDKHEMMRLAVLAGEIDARQDSSSRH